MSSTKACSTRKKATVQLYESAAALPVLWDQLAGDNPGLSRAQLAFYESTSLPDINTCYAGLTDGGKLVAIACFQVLKINSRHINRDLSKGIRKLLLPRLLDAVRPRLLVAGQLFRHDVQHFYAPLLSNMEAYRAYDQMIMAVLQQTCSMAVLVKDLPAYLVAYFQNFAPRYTLLRNDISMQLELDPAWNDFPDYEGSLKHKYAQKLRKVRGAGSSLEIRSLSVKEVLEQSADLYRLYLQVSKKQVVSLGFLNEAFLPALKAQNPDELRVWGFYEQGKMVAFASAWLKEDTFDMFYIGFDYTRNNELQLYFNILYFSVGQAIAHRKSRLILGRTALEAKARLGCIPEYLHTFLYIRNRFIQNLVRLQLDQQYSSEGDWEERHPFKNNTTQK